MSDPRVLRWLRTIDGKLDEAKTERARSLLELTTKVERHEDRLDGHDGRLDDHEARVGRLEDRFDRALHAWRTGKKPPKRKG